jgi:hypothetical protein
LYFNRADSLFILSSFWGAGQTRRAPKSRYFNIAVSQNPTALAQELAVLCQPAMSIEPGSGLFDAQVQSGPQTVERHQSVNCDRYAEAIAAKRLPEPPVVINTSPQFKVRGVWFRIGGCIGSDGLENIHQRPPPQLNPAYRVTPEKIKHQQRLAH